MIKTLLRLFGRGESSSELNNYDPIYGLPMRSLEEWLSRNPTLTKEYEAELAARRLLTPRRRRR